MKKLVAILTAILFAATGCGGGRQPDGDLVIVDVTASYPKKELILQDFLDVEYIPLETTGEFITQGVVLDIGPQRMIVRNHPADGDIFIYDRGGKALRKINRKGQGAEEYTVYRRVVLDEERGELFVCDRPAGRILVYDLDGRLKRTLRQDYIVDFNFMNNFDRENLICYSYRKDDKPSFALISKRNGSVAGEIPVSFEKEISTTAEVVLNNATYYINPDTYNPILPYFDSRILVEPSADTIYSYSPGRAMTPLIVRTPSIGSMIPEIFLFPSLLTDRYYFMDAVRKEVDTSKEEWFPTTNLMYDREEKALFRYTVYNDDFTDGRPVKLDRAAPVVHSEIVAWLPLEASDLPEDYEKGRLKGRLAEIASGLDKESNVVIMLLKHKK